MTSKDVVEILDRLDSAGIRAWVDGGWGVDALIGNETRPHRYLDVALHSDDLELARPSWRTTASSSTRESNRVFLLVS